MCLVWHIPTAMDQPFPHLTIYGMFKISLFNTLLQQDFCHGNGMVTILDREEGFGLRGQGHRGLSKIVTGLQWQCNGKRVKLSKDNHFNISGEEGGWNSCCN